MHGVVAGGKGGVRSSTRGLLEASWGPHCWLLEPSGNGPWGSQGPLGSSNVTWGPSWTVIVPSCAVVGGPLGAILGLLRAILGLLRAILGSSCGLLGPSSGPLGTVVGIRGSLWKLFGAV